MHESQNTVDTSSSQILTVIENKKNNQNLILISKNSISLDDNGRLNSLYNQTNSSSIEEEQQQNETYFKGNLLSCHLPFIFYYDKTNLYKYMSYRSYNFNKVRLWKLFK